MSKRQWRLGVVAVCLVAFLLHLEIINHELVYDDHRAVTANAMVTDGLNIVEIFKNRYWGPDEKLVITWRPLTTLTYALSYAIHGDRPTGYHIVNLILHGLATLLVVFLARKFQLSRPGALLVALLYAVHPIHVDAIAPAVGRSDLLLTVFSIGAILLWESGRTGLSLVLLSCALLSKEMGVVTAAVLIFRDWTLSDPSGRRKSRTWRGGGVLILLGIWFIGRYFVLKDAVTIDGSTLENPVRGATLYVRSLTAGVLYLKALGLMAVPATLLREYSFAVIVPVEQITVASFAGLLLLFLTVFATIWTVRRQPNLSAALFLWVSGFFVVSHIFVPAPMIFAERVFYFSSVGLLLAFVCFFEHLLLPTRSFRVFVGVLLITAVCYAVRSVYRVRDWRDDTVAILSSLRDAPNAVKNLLVAVEVLRGTEYLSDEQAGSCLERALALKPNSSSAHLESAKFHLSLGNRDEALHHLKMVHKLRPGLPRAQVVDCAYASRFELPNALKVCERAITVAPKSSMAWECYAIELDKSNRAQRAEEAFLKSLSVGKTPNVTTLTNYGIFLLHHGRITEAQRIFRMAIQMHPNHDLARHYLRQIEGNQ